MNPELIWMGIFLGIVIGVGGAFLLVLLKNKKQKKNLINNITKQDLKSGGNGIPINVLKEIENPREPKEVVKKEEVKEKKVVKKQPGKVVKKKVRVKKK